MESCNYLIDKVQINEELKVQAEVAYPQLWLSSSLSDIRYFLEQFPILILSGKFVLDATLGFKTAAVVSLPHWYSCAIFESVMVIPNIALPDNNKMIRQMIHRE